jgi:hypothetical protein
MTVGLKFEFTNMILGLKDYLGLKKWLIVGLKYLSIFCLCKTLQNNCFIENDSGFEKSFEFEKLSILGLKNYLGMKSCRFGV